MSFLRCLAFLCVFLIFSTDNAFAKSQGKQWKFSLGAGGRGMTHRPFPDVLSTPPSSGLFEFQTGFWYRDTFALYLLFGYGLMGASSTEYGGGFKFRFVAIGQNARRPAGIVSFLFIADYVFYDVEEAAAPKEYRHSQAIPRVGLGVRAELAQDQLYLEISTLACKFSENFFLAPYIGLEYTLPL